MIVCSTCGKENQVDAHFCNWCGGIIPSGSLTGRLPSQTLLNNGRYLIIKLLGQGGMGAVYKALDQAQQRAVAIKEMSQSGLSRQELQEAIIGFTREATLLARLTHPNLPRIYQQFEENDRRYLVMDFIEGTTLEQYHSAYQQQGKRIPLMHILDMTIQLCSVLEYLHSQQPAIIFRDLKPDNIMLTPQRQVYLIDFGIARLFKSGQTKDTIALGSPGYASPEQYCRTTSPRSDIYSLGAVLHRMLTGNDPAQTPFQFRTFSCNIPALETLVMSMVQTDASKRPESIKSVREALQRIARHLSQDIRNKASTEEKQAVQKVTGPPSIKPVTICVLVSTAPQDQHTWQSIHRQLNILMSNIPNITIDHGLSSLQENNARYAAMDRADMLLLVLSEDFLISPICMADAKRALNGVGARKRKVLSILARPCAWQQTPLASVPLILSHPIMHLSLYAQEQQIAAAARAIRKQLTALMLAEQQAGPMNLLQWLMWQLYSNGGTICPYFVVKHYALKYVRPSGNTGVLFQLLDLQMDRVIADYAIDSHNSSRLTSLLRTIAPSCPAPLYVLGVALRKRPQ
jgi:serine/threonine protein kinase